MCQVFHVKNEATRRTEQNRVTARMQLNCARWNQAGRHIVSNKSAKKQLLLLKSEFTQVKQNMLFFTAHSRPSSADENGQEF